MSRTAGMAVLAIALSIALASLTLGSTKSASVPYPTGYRAWNHLKSMAIVGEKHPLFGAFAGIHHIYVNRIGLESSQRGRPYPDGTVLVFDLLEAHESDGAYAEGPRKFIGVMRKDSRAYAATGGWGFEGFRSDTRDERMVTDAAQQCFNCHVSQKSTDFVFSTYRN